MQATHFVDYLKFYARSGKGGAGAVHFRREKFVPKGGPDGGDGGRGGSIFLRGNKQRSTLLHLKSRKHVIADNGRPGEGGDRFGACGKDIILDVPLGTVATAADDSQLQVEVMEHGKKYLLLPGGRGGLGNTHFKTARQQVPRYAQPGEPGQEANLTLELKLLAEVGLVGLPNAGKSTLLSVVSAAKPKIADYPFTTLIPNLGIVRYRGDGSMVMADIPGIIEGAAQGKGLGTRFLRHIERNAVLLFVIAIDDLNVRKTYDKLMAELKAYNPELLTKRRLLAISKVDLADEELEQAVSNEFQDIPHLFISAIAEKGLMPLKDKLWEMIHGSSSLSQ